MTIQELVQLRSFNTLRLNSVAEFFVRASSSEGVLEALQVARAKKLCVRAIGGGSNVILPPELSGLTLNVALKGRTVVSQSSEEAVVRIYAGEDWHETVVWAHELGLYGLENLALIPGSVGAAPVQNIGAYGAEVAERIERLQVIHRRTSEVLWLANSACDFAYRDSFFKSSEGREWIITAVELRLSKLPITNTTYPALIGALGSQQATPSEVMSAVIKIRRAKLPDPQVEPNAGSFFKNPVVTEEKAKQLKEQYPKLPQYPLDGGRVKLSAAWMIDALNWRGQSQSGVCVSEKHALVIVNRFANDSHQVIEFAKKVSFSVSERFDVQLDLEPEQVAGNEY
ncbi:UDP-N-acetylmuramate dehydrogenase [Luminiphilus sp.]|nr:UDP-N-acetylmuramate dehydrogenase [Luminiphilus sp.]